MNRGIEVLGPTKSIETPPSICRAYFSVRHPHEMASTRIGKPPTPRALDCLISYEIIKKWAERSQNFLWAQGVPGAGKMCVANAILSKWKGTKFQQNFTSYAERATKLPNLNRDGNHRSLVDTSNLRAASYHFQKFCEAEGLGLRVGNAKLISQLAGMFVVCDAGGGTVDVATYNLTPLDKLRVEEPVTASRDERGSSVGVVIAVMGVPGCGKSRFISHCRRLRSRSRCNIVSCDIPLPSELDRLTDEP